MKKQVRRTMLGVIGGCSIAYGMWIGLHRSAHHSNQNHSVSLVFDHIYSDTIAQNISHMPAVHEAVNPDRVQQLAHQLTTSFPVVSRIWSEVDGTLHRMHIVGTRPRYVINNDMIVGEDRRCLPRDAFAAYDDQKLDHFFVARRYCGAYLDEHVDQFLQNIPDWVRNHYTLTYDKPTRIVLHDANANISVIADEPSLRNEKKLAQITDITCHYTQHKKKRRGKQDVLYDVRFSGRVIVRPRVKGECVA